ncbi:MAG: cysteine desulfurase, partial [Firmicutes bacterium]|nr:cysteine desulfurase [Bacillota bacterium]
MMKREVYLDNSATTQVRPEVAAAVMETMTRWYGNPSSLHQKGLEAEGLVEEAREAVARSLCVQRDTIYFTSGGTEANNLALWGAARARARRGRHIITTAIEHPSVLNVCGRLREEGYDITLLPVDGAGILQPEELRAHLRPETILLSTMQVNNEIGSIQPLAEIGAVLREEGSDLLWHVDAIQGFGKLPLKPRELGIDLLSLSGHKFHGPKGVGALYVAEDVHLKPLFAGGGQEGALRSGTENVPGIVGLGLAAKMAAAEREEAVAKMASLKELLLAGL